MKKLVSSSIKEGEPIMLVEMMGCGKTIKEMMNLIGSYPKVHKVLKRDNGGGEEILAKLKEQMLAPDKIKICGLYTNCCISDTIWELAKKSSVKIDVMEKACIGTTRQMHLLAIKDISSLLYKRVRIIK
jgi:hypothetical protein